MGGRAVREGGLVPEELLDLGGGDALEMAAVMDEEGLR